MRRQDKGINESITQASEWLDTAKAAFEEPNLERCLASAVISLAHANIATIEYIRERDAEPHNHDKHMLDLGIEIGEQLGKRANDEQVD